MSDPTAAAVATTTPATPPPSTTTTTTTTDSSSLPVEAAAATAAAAAEAGIKEGEIAITIADAPSADPNSLVGKKVAKYFSIKTKKGTERKPRPYIGTIVEEWKDPTGAAMWSIQYADGDDEDMNADEVESALKLYEEVDAARKSKREEAKPKPPKKDPTPPTRKSGRDRIPPKEIYSVEKAMASSKKTKRVAATPEKPPKKPRTKSPKKASAGKAPGKRGRPKKDKTTATDGGAEESVTPVEKEEEPTKTEKPTSGEGVTTDPPKELADETAVAAATTNGDAGGDKDVATATATATTTE